MRLLKTVASIIVFTITALVYVHQQVELVKLSYAIETKEKTLQDILDRKDRLNYNINNLASPSRLEQVLVAKKIDMAFPRRHNVVKVAKLPARIGDERLRMSGVDRRFNPFGIVDFLSPRAEAQVRER